MNRAMSSKVVAVAMSILLPASLLSAETRGAMVFATNSALLNGAAVTNSSAIFPGDKLKVSPKSSATITLTGTSILVPATSAVIFNGESVSLEHNAAVAITTTSGMAARISNILITPAKNAAKFEVARFNGHVYVAAKQGSVTIADSSGSHAVAEGSTTKVADPEPQKPGAIPATTGVGLGDMPTWVAVLIGLGAAGAAAGVAILTTDKPVSPVRP